MTYQMPKSVGVQKAVPSTGQTVNISASDSPVIVYMINNTGLLLALTVSLPTGAFDGQLIRATFNAAITAVSWTGVANLGGLTAAIAGGYVAFVWDSDGVIWRRCA